MNKNRMFKLLIVVLFTTLLPVAYAETSVNASHLAAYRCASMTEPLQRVFVNLGKHGGFVQLDVPANSQPVSISVLKQCLLQNGLMSKPEFEIYSRAVEACRRAHAQKKVRFSRGSMTNISTSKAFDFDHCLQNNLLN